MFSCSWTCTNTSRICFIAVTISLWYQVKNSAHIYTIVHNNLLDYYSFRVCFPNENKPATNIDNQMYEEALWLWLAVIHESSAEAGVWAFFPPKDSTNLPLKSPKFQQQGPRGGKNWSHNNWAPHNSLLITKQEKLNSFQTSAAKCKHFPHAKNTNKSVLVQLRAGSTAHSSQPQAALLKSTEFRTQMFCSCFQSHYLTIQLLENIHLPLFLSPLCKCSFAQRYYRNFWLGSVLCFSRATGFIFF